MALSKKSGSYMGSLHANSVPFSDRAVMELGPLYTVIKNITLHSGLHN